jgi:hypothetical protein
MEFRAQSRSSSSHAIQLSLVVRPDIRLKYRVKGSTVGETNASYSKGQRRAEFMRMRFARPAARSSLRALALSVKICYTWPNDQNLIHLAKRPAVA